METAIQSFRQEANGANVIPLKLKAIPDAETVTMSPRRFSVPLLDIIGEEVKKLEDGSVIAKSLSSYSAAIVMVKQNGKYRMCIDYSALNKTLVSMQQQVGGGVNINWWCCALKTIV